LFSRESWVDFEDLTMELAEVLRTVPSALKLWASIEPAAQADWQALGWTPKTWDNGTLQSTLVACVWGNLSHPLKAAARRLGFTPESWLTTDDWLHLARCRVVPSECQLWDDMPIPARRVWGLIGWNRSSWDDGATPPMSTNATWEKLGMTERLALSSLGHNRELWEGSVRMDEPEQPTACAVPTSQMDWADMGEEARADWSALGWHEGNWGVKGRGPPSSSASWRLLLPAEREAARRLGYTKALWEADN